MSSRQKDYLHSSAMKRTSEWIFSQEIPSDVTIQIGDTSFSLHKLPLVSKSGYIKKLISESKETDDNIPIIEISNIPGGEEAFELAAKFCYDIKLEINTENIAMLRCVAEYLEMTEDYAVGNLISISEAYFIQLVLNSLSSCVSILVTSESFISMAEQVKLVSRCIDAIAYLACCENTKSDARLEGGGGNNSVLLVDPQQKPIGVVDYWWAEDLSMLRIGMFQRVLIAMISRGFKQFDLAPILMLYAQKSLRGLESFGKGRKKLDPKQEHEKRVVLETIVGLLPRDKNILSVSFLSMLLRSSIYLETTVACRLDLERRISLQLSQAVIDDLLIPSSSSFTGDITLFDVDTVRRIMMNYIDQYEHQVLLERDNCLGYGAGDDHVSLSSTTNTDHHMERVGKLMETYLCEIASDPNLTVYKFIGIAEIIPQQSRLTQDGIYRSIDIFLKAHPTLSDMERKKVCSVMDCQKLSREACAHAAQNDRLPVQTVVQVLYYEQQRLRESMIDGGDQSPAPNPTTMGVSTKTLSMYPATDHKPSSDEFLKLRRENEELKIEILKLKVKLKEVEKGTKNTSTNISSTSTPARNSVVYSDKKPPLPRKSFINSVSKRLGRMLIVGDVLAPPSKARPKPPKDRRHSIS